MQLVNLYILKYLTSCGDFIEINLILRNSFVVGGIKKRYFQTCPLLVYQTLKQIFFGQKWHFSSIPSLPTDCQLTKQVQIYNTFRSHPTGSRQSTCQQILISSTFSHSLSSFPQLFQVRLGFVGSFRASSFGNW